MMNIISNPKYFDDLNNKKDRSFICLAKLHYPNKNTLAGSILISMILRE